MIDSKCTKEVTTKVQVTTVPFMCLACLLLNLLFASILTMCQHSSLPVLVADIRAICLLAFLCVLFEYLVVACFHFHFYSCKIFLQIVCCFVTLLVASFIVVACWLLPQQQGFSTLCCLFCLFLSFSYPCDFITYILPFLLACFHASLVARIVLICLLTFVFSLTCFLLSFRCFLAICLFAFLHSCQ